MSYIKNEFLLTNKSAEKLYFDYAKDMPIFDYHCHLSEKQILANKEFADIYEIWLGGDHYKWRLMRDYGIAEDYITGKKSNKEKFITYCTVLGTAFGNPLYHWSQVELKEYFDCEVEINEKNAEIIWDWCNDYIHLKHLTPQKLIENSNVKTLFTTNEIFDDLSTFGEIKSKGYSFKVIPAFRADKIMDIAANNYVDSINKLKGLTHKIDGITSLEKAVEKRLQEFITVGTTAADIALEKVYEIADKKHADEVFKKVLKGKKITEKEEGIFKGYFTYFLMKTYAKYNIRTELHIGAMRNNNTIMLKKLGLDSGYDSISDVNSIKEMAHLFDRLNTEKALPCTIVFNLNPKMNIEIVTLIACFQDSSANGKLQYGPAWWFLDSKSGIEKQLQDLANNGHLGAFVGMLTDSRSFLSYPRHHYFRRILCNFLGEKIEKGEMTTDMNLVGKVVQDICYNNSVKYFNVQ